MAGQPTASLRYRQYHHLMPHRVREVLLVSSLYDAFILQEDGHLTEQVFLEYKSLALSSAPRFTHVRTGEEAIQALEKRRFDLVLVMPRLADTDLLEFGRRVKELRPGKPLVVLAFDNHELESLRSLNDSPYIDAVFSWNGNAAILLAIIKYIEDRENVDHDIEIADVRVILLVEDSIRFFSEYLADLYPEMMKQSQRLFSEGLNQLQKLMRMRTRPKVLAATHYESAIELIEKYRDNLIALITDAGFERAGRHEKDAGLRLTEWVRGRMPDLPILFQSANEEFAAPAHRLGARFLNKNSSSLLHEINQFLQNHLGFGDFVFRLPHGEEIARATDMRELEQIIETIPAESLEYHALRNHISNWLMARSEFETAARLRPRKVSDFKTIEDVRGHVLQALRELRRFEGEGIITDFSVDHFDIDSLFQRIGTGSLGGKARGLAFINLLMTSHPYRGMLGGMAAKIPQSFAIATDYFDQFLAENELHRFAFTCEDDAQINHRFLQSRLPARVMECLQIILDHLHCPLAVRSSSLLEDDMSHPFAGIYQTIMLANNSTNPMKRLMQLSNAVKLVYASTFHADAKAYIENTGHRIEQEKMAVVIERVVGQPYGGRFYPHFAGVAQSYNYYPIGPQKAEDGVAQLAFGLGRMVVEGGHTFRFSPRHPRVTPQFAVPTMFLKNSQNRFYSLDLSAGSDDGLGTGLGHIRSYPLSEAEADGTLARVASHYDPGVDAIVDGPDAAGPWVVTFNNILKYGAIPLDKALDELLALTSAGMSCAVEVEFACDLGDFGRRLPRGAVPRPPTLYPLQLRPIVTKSELTAVDTEEMNGDRVLCRSLSAMGHGSYPELRDIVYVKHGEFDPARSAEIARQVGAMNHRLYEEKRSYVLIGPGRWGSSDHWLGIPVTWSQISNAKIIIEASPASFTVDPSQGSHFFHNITSLGVGYFTIPPGADKATSAAGFVDWQWLDGHEAVAETEFLRHVRLSGPLTALVDGRKGIGVISRGVDAEKK
ncbi:MAG: histidine kinase [Myxococcales bacterium]|nr:histidine kinase [Myxococcales bacterium]